MRFCFTAILLVWNVVALAVPQGSWIAQRDSVERPTFFSFNRDLFRAYEHSAAQILFHPSEGYGLSRLGMSMENGDWRTYQMPGSSRHYRISSRGNYRLNKIRLTGEFDYQRRLDDSLGWMLKPDQHDRSPYYLANKKAGNWDAHTYLLKGAGSLPLAGLLYFTAGGELQLGTYGRFTDPRPSISRYRLKTSAGLAYSFNIWSIAVSGIYGYGDEGTTVGYASDMNRTIGRPDFVTHDIMGYGYYRPAGSVLVLNEDNKTKGLALVLDAGSFNFSYVVERTNRDYFKRVPGSGREDGWLAVGDVFENRHSLKASFLRSGSAVQRLIVLDACYQKTTDYNHLILEGNNYRGSILSIRPAYQERRGSWEYKLWSGFERERRMDGTAAVDYFVKTASLGAGGGKILQLQTGFFKLELEASYRTDLGSGLSVGSQYNEFMRGVVLPDLTYYSSGQCSAAVALGYGFKVMEVVMMPLFSFGHSSPVGAVNHPEAGFLTGSGRKHLSFSLNIHM